MLPPRVRTLGPGGWLVGTDADKVWGLTVGAPHRHLCGYMSSCITGTLSLQVNIVMPCVLLSLLSLAVFWVPAADGEKVSSGISVFLAFSVFLLMLTDNIPKTSLHVPIFGE